MNDCDICGHKSETEVYGLVIIKPFNKNENDVFNVCFTCRNAITIKTIISLLKNIWMFK